MSTSEIALQGNSNILNQGAQETYPRPSSEDQNNTDINAQKSIEIINRAGVDIAINCACNSPDTARRLADNLEEYGIPTDWTVTGGTPRAALYEGEFEGKRYLAKEKSLERTDKEMTASIRSRRERNYSEDIRSRYAGASILGELTVAPIIKDTLDSKHAQKIATDAGYKSITYIEPILAVISKLHGKKATIYEFIEGLQSIRDYRESLPPQVDLDELEKQNVKMISAIRTLLVESGIMPHDLTTSQVLRDSEGNLYLSDAEYYTRNNIRSDIGSTAISTTVSN